jgi:hypothetical protein
LLPSRSPKEILKKLLKSTIQKALWTHLVKQIITRQKFLKKRIATIKQRVTKISRWGSALAVLPFLFFYLSDYGQIDPKKVDSLSRLIDSSAQAYKAHQDSVVKSRDSAYKSELNEALQQHSRNPGNFSAEQKRREENERRQDSVRIVLGVLLFVIAIITLMRSKKSKP